MTATRGFPGWEIIEGAGGGYIAIRTVLVPEHSALSNVRCGATLPELFEHLEEEARGRVNVTGRRGRARDRAG
ncbi:hypothetical protein [Nonomuraea angiospora]|uniref:hypothetical protein n=1 Tax=Nonomuraea angiospora TaxID=46172 RepID=UPI0029AA7314|nr:hypothetical protein [Nonomuraea angiospora]MDX3100683.1 hypothetical protein [Nonomuraea angiospora]